MKKIKNENGYTAVDAILGVGIFLLLSGAAIFLMLNIYNANLSMHRVAMATNYAVQILENAKLLNYYDSKLNEGMYEGKELLGVTLSDNYNAKLNIKDYNKLEGNENKENLLKILELDINYQDGNLVKNIKIHTLKENNNI